ncbi:hypothetical protein [Streptomyces sp. V3I7]|uniref:hypothetical protein n=1 Tax=Streptomyces sp. V3I7 TaxID=3042278 RepID=UPI002788E8C5|nr:hypothetical protein [Streptomyces sp. V3I7]MDQ0988883.1 hypothetical protein [Streptomyces sp. V3I7]
MALFRRSRPNHSSPPGWCSWFGAEEWAVFQELVRACLAPDYAGAPRIAWPAAGGSPVPELDLVQLALWLRNEPPEQWRTTVEQYPQWCAEAEREAQEQRAMPYASARGALLPVVRLAEGYGNHRLDAMTRVVGGGLVAEVQLKGEYGDLTIDTEQTRRWDVSPAEVWSAAMANLRREPCDIHEAVAGDSPLCVVLGTGEHTAAQVLRLDELIGRPAPYGVLVVVPRTDGLVFWIINGPDLLTAGPYLQKYGGKLRDLPEASERRLSEELFWWSDGVLETVVIPDWKAAIADGMGSAERPHTIKGSQRFSDMFFRLMSPPHDG